MNFSIILLKKQYESGKKKLVSGSLLIRDGKLAVAVPHVLMNDPTRGCRIFVENIFLCGSVFCYVGPQWGYGAIIGAVIVGGILEGLLGLLAKYWRGIIAPIVSACVVTSIGFSLLGECTIMMFGNIVILGLQMIGSCGRIPDRHYHEPAHAQGTGRMRAGKVCFPSAGFDLSD